MLSTYTPPALVTLGSVTELTAFQGSDPRVDYFETSTEIQPATNGSRDNCLANSPAPTPNPSSCD